MDELFDEIANSQANVKGINFAAGQGVVEIEELILKNMKGAGATFVARCTVIESKSKGDRVHRTITGSQTGEEEDTAGGDLIEPNAVGSHPSWPQPLKKFKSAPGNVKAMVLSLLGKEETKVTPDQFKEAMRLLVNNDPSKGKVQPARGMRIAYSTYDQKVREGKRAGKFNTYVQWTHIPAPVNSGDEIAKRREELDKTRPLPKQ